MKNQKKKSFPRRVFLCLLAVLLATMAWGADNTLSRALAERDPAQVVLVKAALGASRAGGEDDKARAVLIYILGLPAGAGRAAASSGGMLAPTPRGQKPVVAQVQLTQGLRPGRAADEVMVKISSGKQDQPPHGRGIDEGDEDRRAADVLGALGEAVVFQRDAVDGGLDALGGDRALAQRECQAAEQLVAAEVGPAAVFLDHLGHLEVDALVGGEALVAGQAATAPPHDVTVFVFTGVGDLRVVGAAEGAMHGRVRVPAVGA